jgi:hypothetical protein
MPEPHPVRRSRLTARWRPDCAPHRWPHPGLQPDGAQGARTPHNPYATRARGQPLAGSNTQRSLAVWANSAPNRWRWCGAQPALEPSQPATPARGGHTIHAATAYPAFGASADACSWRLACDAQPWTHCQGHPPCNRTGPGPTASWPSAALVLDGPLLRWVGPTAANCRRLGPRPAAHSIEAGGALITPGLIDCHTHLVYGGDRPTSSNSGCRAQATRTSPAQGGGIASTVRATAPGQCASSCAAARRRLRALHGRGRHHAWKSSPATAWRWSPKRRCLRGGTQLGTARTR